jgi:hypothetical protein
MQAWNLGEYERSLRLPISPRRDTDDLAYSLTNLVAKALRASVPSTDASDEPGGRFGAELDGHSDEHPAFSMIKRS